jgi:UDP-N-acetyl-2-amino-2-deoxyglucuronate dehydrogenase
LSDQKKITFGVVGCGHIGKRHAEMIIRNDEAELIGLCDIKAKAELGIESYDVPFFNNLQELLILKPDVLCVCTPNGLHAQNSLSGLLAGSHVLCEKPMALTNSDCEKVIHAALNRSKQVFCVMQNRYSPPSVWIKDVVDRKLMGNIYMVQINCYWNRDDRYYKAGGWKGNQKLDGGTLFTQFSHFVDILYWLFGDIKNIKGDFRDFNHSHTTDFEDSGMVTFQLADGGMGNLNYSTSVWDSNLESSLTVIGEKGSIKIGGQYMNEVVHCNIEGYEMPELEPAGPANDYGAYKGSAANHHFVIQNVVDSLKGRKTIATNALEGMKVVEIIERIYSHRKTDVLKN